MTLIVADIAKDAEIQKQLTSIHIEEWLKEDVFHLRWWLLIGLILLFIFIWWKIVDKSKLQDVCLFAAIAAIFVMGLREYGEELTLWDYPTVVIPVFPPLSSINLIGLPLIFSIVFQYCRTWKSFIWTALIVTAVFCFVLEPGFTLIGLYELIHWKYYYSYPLYAVIAVCTRAVVNKINVVSKDYAEENSEN